MTLTELRYIVAVARERHFGRAAEKCFVSQPTLSVAIRKLEDELGVTLFERNAAEVTVTATGKRIVEQAQRVLEETAAIKELAKLGKDPLHGPLRLGVIYTIAPYLLPHLVKILHQRASRMPLIIEENFTHRLRDMLKQGEIDCAILALPFAGPGCTVRPVYDERFVVVVPRDHAWAKRKSVAADELKRESMVLLGAGHCFRDHVLEVCPEASRFATDAEGMQRTFEGSSLETIRQMVASGVGVTVLPASSVPEQVPRDSLLAYVPFARPVPERRIALAWRRTFPRPQAVETVRQAVFACKLHGVTMLREAPANAA
ncbi:MAG: LysR family transcriptional regulator [Betaproteobacteria bacterium]|nr:LysR family transcriptional regulator [Betaproteobacteria bacterium]